MVMLKEMEVDSRSKDGRVYSGTLQGFEQDGNILRIRVVDVKQEEGPASDVPKDAVTIKMSLVSTSPVDAFRWQQALAAVWGAAYDQTAAGARVNIADWMGKRVKLRRALVQHRRAPQLKHEGWDFMPQEQFDVKTKVTLANLKRGMKRLFGRK